MLARKLYNENTRVVLEALLTTDDSRSQFEKQLQLSFRQFRRASINAVGVQFSRKTYFDNPLREYL